MSYDIGPYIHKAITELRGKSLRDVQIETSLVWCGRALVAWKAGKTSDAGEYAHEALEHAALSGDDDLLHAIRYALKISGIP